MQRDGNRLQQRGLGKGEILRQQVRDARRENDELGKGPGAAVVAAGNAEDLAVVAQVHFSPLAERAVAAIDGRIKGDAVAFTKTVYVGADAGHDAGGLMSHHERRNPPPGRTVVAVNVAAADSAGGNAYQNFIAPRHRYRELRNFKLVVFREKKSFHGRPCEPTRYHDAGA